MSKQEREEVRRQWRLHEKERKWREAEIAKLEKRGGEISGAELDDLGLWAPRRSPAMEFITRRLKGVSLGDFDNAVHQAFGDLIASDIPLDRHMRALIASEWRRCHLPDQQRKLHDSRSKLQAEITTIKELKRHLVEDRGIPPGKADGMVVDDLGEALGISTVDSLNKKIARAKRQGIS